MNLKYKIVFDELDWISPGDAMFIPDGKEHEHRPKVLTDSVTFFTVEKTPKAD